MTQDPRPKDYNDLINDPETVSESESTIGESDMTQDMTQDSNIIRLQIGDRLSSQYSLETRPVISINKIVKTVSLGDDHTIKTLEVKISDLLWSWYIGLLEIDRYTKSQDKILFSKTRRSFLKKRPAGLPDQFYTLDRDFDLSIADHTLVNGQMDYNGQDPDLFITDDRISFIGHLDHMMISSLSLFDNLLLDLSSLKKTQIHIERDPEDWKIESLRESLDLYIDDKKDNSIDFLSLSKDWKNTDLLFSHYLEEIEKIDPEDSESQKDSFLLVFSSHLLRSFDILETESEHISNNPEDLDSVSDLLMTLETVSKMTEDHDSFHLYTWRLRSLLVSLVKTKDLISDSRTQGKLTQTLRSLFSDLDSWISRVDLFSPETQTIETLQTIGSLLYWVSRVLEDRISEINIREIDKPEESHIKTGLDRLLKTMFDLSCRLGKEIMIGDGHIKDLISDLDFLDSRKKSYEIFPLMTKVSRLKSRISGDRKFYDRRLGDLETLLEDFILTVSSNLDDFSRMEETKKIDILIGDLETLIQDFDPVSFHLNDLISRYMVPFHLSESDPSSEDLEMTKRKIRSYFDRLQAGNKSQDSESEDRPVSSLKYDPNYDPSLWKTGQDSESGDSKTQDSRLGDQDLGSWLLDLEQLTEEEKDSFSEYGLETEDLDSFSESLSFESFLKTRPDQSVSALYNNLLSFESFLKTQETDQDSDSDSESE